MVPLPLVVPHLVVVPELCHPGTQLWFSQPGCTIAGYTIENLICDRRPRYSRFLGYLSLPRLISAAGRSLPLCIALASLGVDKVERSPGLWILFFIVIIHLVTESRADLQAKLDLVAEYARKCATENDQQAHNCPECVKSTKCDCRGKVRYGYGTQWTAWRDVASTIQCTNAAFGDPFSGQGKTCQCQTAGADLAEISPPCVTGPLGLAGAS